MNLGSYKALIQNLPVRQQSFTTKRDNERWQEAQHLFEWYKVFNDNHFFDDLDLTISRQDIFKTKGSIKELIIKTIYWGYPRGMRGNHFKSILKDIHTIEEALTEIKSISIPTTRDFESLSKRFSNIQGLGLSTFSKFLYFLDIRFNGHPCLIFDKRIIGVLNKNIFEDYSTFSNVRYDNAKTYYIRYIDTTNQIAEELQTKGENIEQFLFIFGNNLKI